MVVARKKAAVPTQARTTRTVQKTYAAIRVGDLHVDQDLDSAALYGTSTGEDAGPAAQRKKDAVWTARLTKMWDPFALLPAIVSLRDDGRYYLLDGQHSTEVAIEKEGADFLRDCMVYEGLTAEQEAKLFLAANRDRKAVKPFDIFRVSITAGDPRNTRILNEVESLGLGISGSTSANKIGAVQALTAIAVMDEKHAKRHEGGSVYPLILPEGRTPLIPKVLRVVEDAWGRNTSTWEGIMLRAVGMVLDRNPDARLDRLSSKLAGRSKRKVKTVAQWKESSIANTVGGGGSSSRSAPLAKLIVAEYNDGLSDPAEFLVVPGRPDKD
ncbi:hypothetical protein OG974_30210 (plasmid) [Streptomyces sp. NBC_00597]|uniref:DUF6551 family protein n=1 Tax=unclassified Streptomyces TaxID=2593676 RepID=UPI002E158968|nr:hypothetical protein OG573_40210 [Streptomyces sp. NBC_01205]